MNQPDIPKGLPQHVVFAHWAAHYNRLATEHLKSGDYRQAVDCTVEAAAYCKKAMDEKSKIIQVAPGES